MGASSVTGVGQGAVEGNNMGSKHFSVGANRLVGPRILAAGTATSASGTATVVLPKLDGSATDYVVLVTDSHATAAAANGALAINTNDTTLTLKGTDTHVLQWTIIKIGLLY